MICVSIGRTRHKMMLMEHRALAERGAELCELRVDWLSRMPDVSRLLRDRPTPVIFTCRRQSDRGRWRGTEEQRLSLLRTAIVSEVDYVDLEDDVAGNVPRFGKTKRIVSHHNFDETPADLQSIYERMTKLDPDIIKIVTMANSPSDPIRMLKLVESAAVPTVGFCMGELGLVSRLLCGKYGAPFSYATFSKDREMAPGQLSFEEMQDVYAYPQISSHTQVFGVVGDPLAHSLSPLIHNAAFRHDELDAVYVPIRIPRDQLAPTLKEYEWLDVRGYSVTIPHKEAAMQIASHFISPVRDIGAANTLYRDSRGQWCAMNTDCQAALQSIRVGLGAHPDDSEVLRGRKVLMLGAGGVARAIGFGLVECGAALAVTNRTHKRAMELAQSLGCQQIKWENRSSVLAEIIVNCTSVGMHPNVDETPFQMNWINEGTLVFDTVYNPENTLLLKQAREYGWKTVSGLEMFVRQAAAQYEQFTGQAAPLEHMRETLRRGISAVRH